MKEEALNAFRVASPSEDSREQQARLMKYQAQYNLAFMLEHLPSVVKGVEVQQEKNQAKVLAFKESQEGGSV